MNSSVNIKMLNESLNSKFDLANYFHRSSFNTVQRSTGTKRPGLSAHANSCLMIFVILDLLLGGL